MPFNLPAVAAIVGLMAFASPSPGSAAVSLEPAINSGDVERLRSALNEGGDPNEIFPVFGSSTLMLATIRGSVPMVSLPLGAGAGPNWVNHRGYSALSAAVRSCRAGWDVAAVLLDAGADIENRSGASLTPLMVAIQEKRPTFFRGLLEHGADVDALNAYGEGPLSSAVCYREPEFISLLLDRGVDTDPLRRLITTSVCYYPALGVARPQAIDCAP